jgi:hypothetical protein
MKIKCLTNLTVVNKKWHKSKWLVIFIIFFLNKEIIDENNKSKNEIKCQKL